MGRQSGAWKSNQAQLSAGNLVPHLPLLHFGFYLKQLYFNLNYLQYLVILLFKYDFKYHLAKKKKESMILNTGPIKNNIHYTKVLSINELV